MMTEAETVATILEGTHSIAVVGASDDPDRDSHRVMRYLIDAGFEVLPVNPNVRTILGKRCRPSLTDLDQPVDTVVCFRRSEAIEPIARDAVRIGARHLWLQLGVINESAAEVARAAGLLVVMDRCIMIDHDRRR